MDYNSPIATSVTDFKIRFASREDVPLIFRFIQELATYEKLSHEVVTDEEELAENLFGNPSYAEVVIGEFKGEPVGFALFFHNFSTFLGKPGIHLEDLFVQPEMRGKGFGKSLLSFLGKLAVDRGCGRLEWAVLDWNKPAIQFYESLGAVPLNDWIVYRATDRSLEKLADQF